MFEKSTFKNHWSEIRAKVQDKWSLSDQEVSQLDGDFDKVIEEISRKEGLPEVEIRRTLFSFIPGYKAKSFEEGGTTFELPYPEREELSDKLKNLENEALIKKAKW